MFFAPVHLFVGWFVCLSAGSRKSYGNDFHETLWKDGTRAKKEPIQFWADPGLLWFFPPHSLILRVEAFLDILPHFPRNNASILMKKTGIFRGLISMSECSLVWLDWIYGDCLALAEVYWEPFKLNNSLVVLFVQCKKSAREKNQNIYNLNDKKAFERLGANDRLGIIIYKWQTIICQDVSFTFRRVLLRSREQRVCLHTEFLAICAYHISVAVFTMSK